MEREREVFVQCTRAIDLRVRGLEEESGKLDRPSFSRGPHKK